MSRSNLIKKLNYILNIEEQTPKLTSKQWKNGKFIDKIDINYTLNYDTIYLVKKAIEKKIDFLPKKNNSSQIIKYYKITDNNISRIGITDQTIKYGMIKQLIDFIEEKKSLLIDFPKIENLKFSVVLFTKKNNDNIKKTLKKLEKKHNAKKYISDKYREKCKEIIEEYGDDNKLNNAIIFKIKNNINKKQFIGASINTTNKKKIIKSISRYYPDMENDIYKLKHEISFRILGNIKYMVNTELNIELDYLAEKYNTLVQGYNKLRYVKKKINYENLFMDINRELALKSIVETFDYHESKGIIFMVRNIINNKKYVGTIRGTLKDAINYVYSNKKLIKLYEDLKKYPFSDFEFEIIKINNSNKNNLNIETGKIIERYNTVNTGYN